MFGFEQLQLNGLRPSLSINRLGLTPKVLTNLCAKIRVTDFGCWEWMGAKVKGYGAVHIRALRKNGVIQTHKLCYELVNGPVPEGQHLHHKVEEGCMGPACCNPDHVMPLAPGVHTAQFTPGSASYVNAHKNCCKNGHEFTFENTRILDNGGRQCRQCDKELKQRQRDRERLASGREKFKWRPEKRKTHCKRGHELTEENSYVYHTKDGWFSRCRECDRIRDAQYHGRVRLEEPPVDDPYSQTSEPYVPAKHTPEDPLF